MYFWGTLGIFEHVLQRCRPFSHLHSWMQLSLMHGMKNCEHRKKDGAMKAQREWHVGGLDKEEWDWCLSKRWEEEKMAKNGAQKGGWGGGEFNTGHQRPKPKSLTENSFCRQNLSLWWNRFWCKRACFEVCKQAHIHVGTITVLHIFSRVLMWSCEVRMNSYNSIPTTEIVPPYGSVQKRPSLAGFPYHCL